MARTLYECFNAKVLGKRIYCARGHKLTSRADGSMDVRRLALGKPLVCRVCQLCHDFESMGGPVAREDRGWMKLSKRKS